MTTTVTPAPSTTTLLPETPGYLRNVMTFGVAMASWVAQANATLGQGGAGFLFAWFFAPYAHYGLAKRLNAALQAQGSSTRVSPLACLFLVGVPLIGSRRRLARGAAELVRR